jgi:hypothetical protein
MTAEWTMPAWLVVVTLSAAALVLLVAAVVVARLRTRVARDLELSHAELAALRHQVEELEHRQAGTQQVVGEDGEFVITSLATAVDGDPREDEGPVSTVEARLFGDIVLRETVVQAASLVHGVRRALSPETRNRIRFEMKREVKRSRKQRRADLREARREWEARQRADVQLEPEQSEDSAA